jgi:hypothetical protein
MAANAARHPDEPNVRAAWRSFTRRIGVDRERVHAAGKLAGQRRIDHAVALDPGLPLEGIRHDIDPEMRLSAGAVAGMTFMLVGFVDHAQARRRESLGQLLRDQLAGSHGPA